MIAEEAKARKIPFQNLHIFDRPYSCPKIRKFWGGFFFKICSKWI